MGSQDRRRIVAELYPEAGSAGHWWFRFMVMLVLSVVIAVLGLSLNSDAVVIGAMLIAPLMTPLIGTAAALVMGWPRRLAQSGLAVLAGSAAAMGISYVLTLLLPAAGQALTPAVLSRTSPDLRDLVVALAAGAAGAYATAREDVSAALPGVAVAVALVPPLAAAGFTLAIGREDLTGGAVLLFVANLVAIVLISSVVLAASGFVPSGRFRAVSGRIRFGLLSAVVALVLVAAPLADATLASDSHAQTTQAVNQAAVSWLAPYPSLTLTARQHQRHAGHRRCHRSDLPAVDHEPGAGADRGARSPRGRPGPLVPDHLGYQLAQRGNLVADAGADPARRPVLAGRRGQHAADHPAHQERRHGQRRAGGLIGASAR